MLLGFAVPVFAFFAAGVSVADVGGLGAALGQTVTVLGLVVGKAVGIFGATGTTGGCARRRSGTPMRTVRGL